MAHDSNTPFLLNTNRRFVLTMGTAFTLITGIYIVSANYFEMRAADRDTKVAVDSQEARIKRLEDSQVFLVNKVDVMQNDVRWIRAYMEQRPKQ